MKFAINISFVVPALIVISASIWEYSPIRTLETLKSRGVATEGTIVGLRTVKPRRSVVYKLDYQFEAKIGSSAQSATYQGTDDTSFDILQRSKIGGSVPIVYDPQDPKTSIENIEDKLHHRYIFRVFVIMLLFSLGFWFFVRAVMWMPVDRRFYRERYLLRWGRAAPATIVHKSEYLLRNGLTRAADVTYRFTDAEGKVVEGLRRRVLTGEAGMSGNALKVWLSPTALFDPRNSAKNMLYPATFLDCISPDEET